MALVLWPVTESIHIKYSYKIKSYIKAAPSLKVSLSLQNTLVNSSMLYKYKLKLTPLWTVKRGQYSHCACLHPSVVGVFVFVSVLVFDLLSVCLSVLSPSVHPGLHAVCFSLLCRDESPTAAVIHTHDSCEESRESHLHLHPSLIRHGAPNIQRSWGSETWLMGLQTLRGYYTPGCLFINHTHLLSIFIRNGSGTTDCCPSIKGKGPPWEH